MNGKVWSRALAIAASMAMIVTASVTTASAAVADEPSAAAAQPTAEQASAAAIGEQFAWKTPLTESDATVKSDKAGDATVVYDGQKASGNKLTIDPQSIERQAYWNSCVTATGAGFASGETVNFADIAPSGTTIGFAPVTADDSGKATAKLCANTQATEIGAHTITATGATSKAFADGTLQVTANARETATVTIENGNLTQDQFIDQKISIRAEGFTPGARLFVLLEGPDGTTQNFADSEHIRADADGVFTDALQSNSVNFPAGTWWITVQDMSSSTNAYGHATFTIAPGRDRQQNKTLDLGATTITATEFAKNGLKQIERDFAPFDAFDVYMTTPLMQTGLIGTARANGDGIYENTLTSSSGRLGTYTIVARSRTTGDYAQESFTVTDDQGNAPAPIDVSITPDAISKSDFGPTGAGVSIVAKNLPENLDGTITVQNSRLNLQRIVDTTSDDPSGSFMVFLERGDDGTITYQAKLATDPLDETYKVEITFTGGGSYAKYVTVGTPSGNGSNAGGANGNDNANNGSNASAGQPEQGGQATPDLIQASGTVSAFIEVKGTSALSMKRSSEAELAGDSAKDQRSADTANAQADNATQSANAVFDQLRQLDRNASKLYVASYSVPGVAVRADAKALATLAGQSDQVTKIAPIVQRTATTASTKDATDAASAEPANANNDTLVNARKAWEQTGKTGKGVNIAIIDTGIDYTHADFGGDGSPFTWRAASQSTEDPLTNPDLAGKIDTAKYKGGYDFAGATYNADSSQPDTVYDPIPHPDANPLDGVGGGHGSHVAGTAAGYGENGDKTTFRGDYAKLTDADLQTMEIGPGAAPEAGIYMLKVFGDNGGATDVTGAALDWVAQQLANNVDIDVVSMSLGTSYGAIDDPDSAKINAIAAYGTLSIAAAGNDGDYTDIGGSPASTPGALAVAASQSGGVVQDAIRVTAPSDLAGDYAGQYSQYYGKVTPTYTVSGKVVKLTDAKNLEGCAAYSDADAARVKGNIVYVEWNDADVNCGSGMRFDYAYKAGAVGIVFASQSNVLESGIAGNYDIPGFQMTKDAAAKLQPAIDAGTLELTLSSDYAQTIRSQHDENRDVVASFTSRGVHGSYDGTVKPDVAAPGVGIVSVANGTGNAMTVMSGTSMATPLTSGVAALTLEAHPEWTGAAKATNLKAQLMNTAAHDVTTKDQQTAYGPLRVGTGRIDAYAAVNNDVRVTSDDVEAVTASFGIVQVGKQGVTQSRRLTVTNDSDAAHTYDVAYAPRTETPGVYYTVSESKVTVPAHGTVSVTVTLSIPDATALRHTLDPTMDAQVGGLDRSYVTDATGVVTFTPADDAGAYPLRVSVVAAPKPVSETTSELSFADDAAKDGTLTITGDGVNQGTGSEAYVSRFGALQLGAEDPVDVWGSELNLTAKRSISAADIRAVGAATTAPQLDDPSEGMLAFGVQTQQTWSRLGSTIFPSVYFDVSGDGRPDYVTTLTTKPFGSQIDGAYAMTYDLASNSIADIEPLDDASISDSNTVILPVSLKSLGYTKTTTQTTIRYQVSMESIYAKHTDADANFRTSYLADTADTATFDVYHPDLWFGDANAGAANGDDANASGTLLYDDAASTVAAHRGSSDSAKNARALILHLRGQAPEATGSAPVIDTAQKPTQPADKTALQQAIAAAKALNAADYTADTWNALVAALSSAEQINANADATQQQVNDATDALNAAIAGLQRAVPGDQPGTPGGTSGSEGATNEQVKAEAQTEAKAAVAALSNTGASTGIIALASLVLLAAGALALTRRSKARHA